MFLDIAREFDEAILLQLDKDFFVKLAMTIKIELFD
jgi:hypothetical protein